MKELIVVEYDLPDTTKDIIIDYNNAYKIEEDLLNEILLDVLVHYINFHNILEFSQEDYLGIELSSFNIYNDFYNTLLKPFYFKIPKSSSDWDKLFYDSIKCTDYIDNYIGEHNERLKNFLFLLESFNINCFSSRMTCINYIASLEFLLTHKPNDKCNNYSIFYQLKTKVRKCYNDLNIKNDDIEKIIRYNYDYRSDILHGNFDKIDSDIKNLTKLSYITNELKQYDLEGINIYETENNNILYLNAILLKDIFKNIFIYLSNNTSMINKLKKE